MNSILQNNFLCFSKRFPELFYSFTAKYGKEISDDELTKIMNDNEIEIAKAKSGTVSASRAGVLLHSAYDPIKDAKKIVASALPDDFSSGVFFSFGLGYALTEFALLHGNKNLVIVEPSTDIFLIALAHVDFTPVFEHPSCILLLDAPEQTVLAILEKLGLADCFYFKQKNHMQHAVSYFNRLETLISRNIQKKVINENTLEKFALLWSKNMCQNLIPAAPLDGINRYEQKANLPVCILAAGPSLDDILIFLPQLKERCILICVDTALRAVLNSGVEPHFIVVADPQYWNYRHLDGLSASESILITELAAYPPVFRFPCKEIILCSSLYPMGKFIEQRAELYGAIGAGGSVATTAWDFARFLGSKTIITAGLDLGFPENKTHYHGSTFEERAHLFSNRLHPAENDFCLALYGAAPFLVQDYEGNDIFTDARMSLYAWWFESKMSSHPDICAYTLSPKGIKIPGIKPIPLFEVLKFPKITDKIHDFLNVEKPATSKAQKSEQFFIAVQAIQTALQEITQYAQKGLLLAQEYLTLEKHAKATKNKHRQNEILCLLEKIDTSLLQCSGSELAALLFPSQKKLAALTETIQNPIEKTIIIYQEIEKAVQLYFTHLEKSSKK